jgi:hypothetical protein
MELSFKKFMEQQDATASYHQAPTQDTTSKFSFPDIETYKQYWSQQDPNRKQWTPEQWAVQHYFDGETARKKLASAMAPTRKQANTPPANKKPLPI